MARLWVHVDFCRFLLIFVNMSIFVNFGPIFGHVHVGSAATDGVGADASGTLMTPAVNTCSAPRR